MIVDLAALRRKSATVRIVFDDEVLNFTYNPHAYDDECQRIIHNLTSEPDNAGLANMFERLITSWDMVDNGQPVPCTYDSFHKMVIPFLRTKIVNAIIEDEMERGKLRGSDNSSNQERRSALVPIGSRQSQSASGQESANGATSST